MRCIRYLLKCRGGTAVAGEAEGEGGTAGDGVDAAIVDIGVAGETGGEGDEDVSVDGEAVGEGDAGTLANASAAHSRHSSFVDHFDMEAFNMNAFDPSDDSSISDQSSQKSTDDIKPEPTHPQPPTNSPAKSSQSSVEVTQTILAITNQPPESYVLHLIECISLSYFAVKHDVPGDGNCGYYAVMNVLIRHMTRMFPEHPSLHDELSGVSFHQATWFRNMLFEYVLQEYESFLDPSNPVFVDENGVALSDFRIRSRERDGLRRMITHDGRNVSSFFYSLDKVYNA